LVEHRLDECGESLVERLPESGFLQAARQVFGREQLAPDRATHGSGEPRLILGNGALEHAQLTTEQPRRLVRVEQHPDGDGVRYATRKRAEEDGEQRAQQLRIQSMSPLCACRAPCAARQNEYAMRITPVATGCIRPRASYFRLAGGFFRFRAADFPAADFFAAGFFASFVEAAARMPGRRPLPPLYRASATTSSIRSTKWKRMLLRTSSGTSRRSRSLLTGRMTSSIPARCAASTFSFTPPISSTFPRSVTSPLIAMSWRTGRFERDDATASVTAIPAEGPSFGIAPTGKCTCTSDSRNVSSSIPSDSPRLRTYEYAAFTDSRITSPSRPVMMRRPLPGMRSASMNISSPPAAVHARPVTTPTSGLLSAGVAV